jgi:HAD superfamily hydrolase (TIGR01509 family)
MIQNFKAIFFDLDGTLADTMPLLYSVYREFLHRYGHEGSQEEFTSLIGPALYEVVDWLNKKYHLGVDTPALLHEYRKLLFERYAYDTKLFDGVLSFLSYARERGYRLALVTSATEQLAQAFLVDKQIIDYFEMIVTSDNLTSSKPNPAIYRKALELMELESSEAIAIEDSAKGVQAATGAGLYTLHITHHKEERSLSSGKHLRQVADWFEIQNLFETWSI